MRMIPSPIPKPMLLLILDGFGYHKATKDNAIHHAHKPNWDNLLQRYPHMLIEGSGHAVGLPDHQMGNSEVGHMHMGAGRVVYQELTRIDRAIETGEFFKNATLLDACHLAKETHKTIHVTGLLSPGGVHSHERHLHALIQLAAQQSITKLYLHPILDGRDTPPKSAKAFISTLESICQQHRLGKIISLIGRYYAMDRDKRFERIEPAYDLLVNGTAPFHAPDAQSALMAAYERGETDEFVKATTISEAGCNPIKIEEGDIVIFMNFRSDRARELAQTLIDPQFNEFQRSRFPKLGRFISLSAYDPRFHVPVVFPPQQLNHMLGSYLSDLGLHQLRIAETEKYAHVTFFFNGGVEKPDPNEERVLIPSLKVSTYDQAPQMSLPQITEQLITAIEGKRFDVIICNFANADMVGHTGRFDATVKAIEAIDQALGQIIPVLQSVGGEAIITADHGNAENMFDPKTNQPHTAHTNNPVPFIYIGRCAKIAKNEGTLSDIAPTLLYLMNIPPPKEMTGKPLVILV